MSSVQAGLILMVLGSFGSLAQVLGKTEAKAGIVRHPILGWLPVGLCIFAVVAGIGITALGWTGNGSSCSSVDASRGAVRTGAPSASLATAPSCTFVSVVETTPPTLPSVTTTTTTTTVPAIAPTVAQADRSKWCTKDSLDSLTARVTKLLGDALLRALYDADEKACPMRRPKLYNVGERRNGHWDGRLWIVWLTPSGRKVDPFLVVNDDGQAAAIPFRAAESIWAEIQDPEGHGVARIYVDPGTKDVFVRRRTETTCRRFTLYGGEESYRFADTGGCPEP
jgi:hypothetical protein